MFKNISLALTLFCSLGIANYAFASRFLCDLKIEETVAVNFYKVKKGVDLSHIRGKSNKVQAAEISQMNPDQFEVIRKINPHLENEIDVLMQYTLIPDQAFHFATRQTLYEGKFVLDPSLSTNMLGEFRLFKEDGTPYGRMGFGLRDYVLVSSDKSLTHNKFKVNLSFSRLSSPWKSDQPIKLRYRIEQLDNPYLFAATQYSLLQNTIPIPTNSDNINVATRTSIPRPGGQIDNGEWLLQPLMITLSCSKI